MARGDQLARQWKIIQTLISSKMGKSAADLAEDLECHPRTVYRDLEALQIAGFPIYTERVDGKNLWSLLDTVKHQIPIPFSLPELMALYFSSDMMKVFQGTVFYDSLESLFQKVKTTLPPESKIQMKMLIPDEESINLLRATGTIKWFKQIKGKHKKYFLIGVHFRRLTDECRNKLFKLWKKYS